MKGWTLIPAGFGLWWWAVGLSALARLSAVIWLGLAVVALAVAMSGPLLARGAARSFNRRVFYYALFGEMIGIAVVIPASILSQQPSLIDPLVGMVVGLHFLPLSVAFKHRGFIFAGALMVIVGLIALLWPPPLRTAITGIGEGLLLWGFAVWGSSCARPVAISGS